MKEIWNFFNTLNEFVYICDIQNDELVYMNNKTLNTYGLESREQLNGKKCYEILHNNSTRCVNCINNKLRLNEFVESKGYDPRIQKYLLTKDTLLEYNNRLYRLNITIDVSEQEKYNKSVKQYENLEATVNEAIRTAMQTNNPNDAINVILEYLGKTLKGERTYVVEKSANNYDNNTYEWVAKGITPEIDRLQNLPPDVCENWYSSFNEGKPIVLEDIRDIIPINPKQYKILAAQNIHSIVVVPLYHEGKIIGFYGVDNPPLHEIDYVRNMLEITGYFIVAQIMNRNLFQELHDMSYRDQLTKAGNRHAMNKYIKDMNKSRSIGVVYCDITGLKRVNDNEGHYAGDTLIIRCCNFVQKFYGDYGVFRIGGDEILALCSCIDRNEFQQREQRFRKSISETNIPLAVGFSWHEKSEESIGEILSEAEKNMYDDKAEFYKKSGIDRRK